MFNWFVPFGLAREIPTSDMLTLYIIMGINKSQTSAHQTCPSSSYAQREASPASLQFDSAGMLDLCSIFASHLSWAFIGRFEVTLNKQGLCVSLTTKPTLGPWFHQLLIKCLVITVSTFWSCPLCRHLERISSQAPVTYPFCGSRENCVLGDVGALNELSL
jgi:hypothetical protein